MEFDYEDRGPELLTMVTLGTLIGLVCGVAYGLIVKAPVGGLLMGMFTGSVTVVVTGWLLGRRSERLKKVSEET